MLADLGVDIMIEQRSTPQFRSTPAEVFIRDGLCGQLHAAMVSVGQDFHFGFKRSGNREMLAEAGKNFGYRTEMVPPVMKDGQRISSTRVREAIAANNMEEAAELLGYPFFFSGQVAHGKELGRKLGIPTANLLSDSSKLLPPFGVYYSLTHLKGVTVAGMTNVGTNPTVKDGDVRIETHLFDFEGDIYGQDAKVELLHFARPEQTFDGVEALKNQLFRDREAGRKYFKVQSCSLS
jgi:riboflavin kinase/FMN adenylyltransferase